MLPRVSSVTPACRGTANYSPTSALAIGELRKGTEAGQPAWGVTVYILTAATSRPCKNDTIGHAPLVLARCFRGSATQFDGHNETIHTVHMHRPHQNPHRSRSGVKSLTPQQAKHPQNQCKPAYEARTQRHHAVLACFITGAAILSASPNRIPPTL